ncbi:hypothetical protein WJX72_011301 [[Myrmecia] bisecta]|uniref:Amidohydrolase-related domain-containing protein n=1 Tax=[Myrmecia] bisecta TaxID=41462 RepID=A0AAW1Q8Q0_9CHLO
MVSTLLTHIGTLATQNEALGEISDAAVYITDNVVQWVGKSEDCAQYSPADVEINCEGLIILPGLINTHNHMYGSLTRCLGQEQGLFDWIGACNKVKQHFTSHDAHVAAKLTMAELILSGCTTSVDHMFHFPNDVRIDDTIRAAKDIGIRLHAARGTQSVANPVTPACLLEDEESALRDMRRVIEEHHDASKFAMVRVALAPTILFLVSPGMWEKTAQLAAEYPAVGLHCHFCETSADAQRIQASHGVSPHDFLSQRGWNTPRVWCAHCCKVDEAAIAHFGKHQMGVATCPSSSCRLGNGILPLRSLLDKGVNVGIGTDGPASNDACNLLLELRLATYLQRVQGKPDALTAREALRMGTAVGAAVLNRTDIGQIAPGFAADIVGWRTAVPAFCGVEDEVAALVFCSPGLGSVDLSIINGKVIIKDGKFVHMDLQKLMAEHHQCAARLRALAVA